MKLAGLFLLVAGWGIAVFAVGLLPSAGVRSAFVLAGLGTELLGLALLVRAHVVLDEERERP
ncbi:MAG: hypothetical protein WAU58_09015 [Terriglobales bacterium]